VTAIDFERKIVDADAVAKKVAQLARPLVVTNGVFDILHRGHVTYLAQARAMGASLLVAVNSDSSVRQLSKGRDRPVNNEADRAAVLAALESVSLVVVFNEKVPLRVLEIVQPEIYVKGGDYDMASVPEAALVATWGGVTKAIPFVHEASTTTLLKRIRASAP